MSHLAVPVSERDHVSGLRDARVILVEYGDFECPHCARAYPLLHAAQRRLGKKMALVYRHFPLGEIHPYAVQAAEAAEAAGAQNKFWQMHGMLFEHQDALDVNDLLGYAEDLGLDVERFSSELETGIYEKKVRADFHGGVRSGVNGTPTFFINGARYDGDWLDLDNLVGALEQAAESNASAVG